MRCISASILRSSVAVRFYLLGFGVSLQSPAARRSQEAQGFYAETCHMQTGYLALPLQVCKYAIKLPSQ